MRLEFPTKPVLIPRNAKQVSWPVVELVFPQSNDQRFRQKVLIDTGATNTIFPISLAVYLGLHDLDELPIVRIGVGSGIVNGYAVPAQMAIHSPDNSETRWEWWGEIILANVRTSHYGVLGHVGFLEYFDFELRSEENLFTLEDNLLFNGDIQESLQSYR